MFKTLFHFFPLERQNAESLAVRSSCQWETHSLIQNAESLAVRSSCQWESKNMIQNAESLSVRSSCQWETFLPMNFPTGSHWAITEALNTDRIKANKKVSSIYYFGLTKKRIVVSYHHQFSLFDQFIKSLLDI